MQWPLVKFKRFASAPLFLSFSLSVPVCAEVDDNRLWLPGGKYATLFFDLRKAAEAAEALDRCVTVLRGTIDLDRSQAEHPVYRILCRQENGRSYNEMVDGLSFATLTTKVLIPKEPTADELEAARLAEEKRKEEARIARIAALWAECESALKKKTHLMLNVTWLSDFPLAPDEYSDDAVRFSADFDASSVEGMPLKYHANCLHLADQPVKVKISGRKASKRDKKQ